MSDERVFTDEELKLLSTQTIDRAKAAIDAGDAEEAKRLLDQTYAELAHLHDGYMCWVGGLETWIYEHHGVEELEQAERFAHIVEGKIAFKPSGAKTFKERVVALVNGLHGHVYQPMEVTEDDEKVVVTVNPCGSGGRLMEMGGYEPETGMATIKEACNITFGYEDFPMYCIHCPVMRAQDYERSGDMFFVREFVDGKPGPACQAIFYKDRSKTPDVYYERIGKENPHKAAE